MATREGIREGMRDILSEDLIVLRCTHENPPPGKDCEEECGVSLDNQIAASNPIMSPVRSGGKKHKRCMACWEEYIEDLIFRLTTKQSSQGVVIKRELPSIFDTNENMISALEYKKKLYFEPLVEEE